MNEINFKKWAFHFTIWSFIINGISLFFKINFNSITGEVYNYEERIFYLSILSQLMLLLAIVFLVISIVKKEKRNYQFWTTLVYALVFGIIPILILMFGYHFV
ncbi:hypothetical protein [Cellulophaga fucicola]|uniref:Uncharacterized protein n=1 Tax=Cellulophaga fucicola TaxID=76595 RepID=A0A1K1Q8L2_9FLAO|nr:hypothetical protein [Cellulophaga fucicola]SFW56255.1 hypothetical protein SAMN05660313_02465 [Cellulophaga fucicola]